MVAAIDTVPLPEDVLGMVTKKGKVSKTGSKYFLTVGKRKTEIPVGVTVSAAEVNKLVGKEVYAAFSGKRKSEIVAVGTWPEPEKPTRPVCYWIVCYIPAPDILRRIGMDIRRTLIQKMLADGIITPKLAQRIKIAGR